MTDLKELQRLNFYVHRAQFKLSFQMQTSSLHPQQVPILSCVARHEGCTQQYVAHTQQTSPASIGVSVRRLEKSGFLCVEEDPHDRRAKRLFTTEAGRRELELSCAARDEAFRIRLRGFTGEELAQYRHLLEKMEHNLNQCLEKGEKA